MSALVFAAVLALATDPRCGAAAAGSELARRLQAIAVHESGDDRSFADPLAIGVNADPEAGLAAARLHSATAAEAIAKAHVLSAQGRSFDLGLMQINVRSLAQDGLTIDTAFDACRNMKAGAGHFVADIHAVLNAAHRLYNTGSTERGAGYASAIESVMDRIQSTPGAETQSVSTSNLPVPCAPEWDAWALAECSVRSVVTPGSSPAVGASPASINVASKDMTHHE